MPTTLYLPLSILVLAAVVAWVAWELRQARRKESDSPKAQTSSKPEKSNDVIDRLKKYAAANDALVESEAGREALVDFVVSELVLYQTVDSIEQAIEEQTTQNPNISKAELRTSLLSFAKKFVMNPLKAFGAWFKKNKIAGKLADKLNGIVGDAVPGLMQKK